MGKKKKEFIEEGFFATFRLNLKNETLILDVGMGIKDIKKMCDWNVKNIVGCLISHEHY